MRALKLVDNILSQIDDTEQKPQIIKGCNVEQKSEIMDLGELIDSWVTDGKFAGASAAVFRKNKIVYETYKGILDLEQSKPIDKDTLFRCYSMTKPITAVALMILYDEGKFKLDDPVSKYIPNFADMTVYDYDCKENKALSGDDLKLENIKTKKCAVPILISHLLTHTSGLCYCFDRSGELEPVDRVALNYFQFHAQKEFPLSEVIDNKLTKIPLCFEPGTMFNYSFSSDVCGRLVEVISGLKLAEFFYKRIFQPLNMKSTAFYIDGMYNKLNADNLASLYNPSYYGKPPHEVSEDEFVNYTLIKNTDDQGQLNEKEKGCNTSAGGSKGGLISTLGDYMKFCIMLLNDGKCIESGNQILSVKTLRLMRQNHLPNNATIKKLCTERSFFKHIVTAGLGYGFGWAVAMDKVRYLSEGSIMWGGAANTHFWVDPVKEICFVFMTQNIGVNGVKFDWRTPLHRCVYESIVT